MVWICRFAHIRPALYPLCIIQIELGGAKWDRIIQALKICVLRFGNEALIMAESGVRKGYMNILLMM